MSRETLINVIWGTIIVSLGWWAGTSWVEEMPDEIQVVVYYHDEVLEAAPILADPFQREVAKWSHSLKDWPPPAPDKGNCLPVAKQLQKRIVATGRMAIIIGTNPTPEDNIGHAMVMYDSDKDGRFDSVIDNGYSTKHIPQTRDDLYAGEFGAYLGQCKEEVSLTSCVMGEKF